MKKFLNEQKGITLIATIVTVIILLILAALSISTLTGKTGIIQQASDAEQNANTKKLIEDIQVAVLYAGNTGDGKIDLDELNSELSKIVGNEVNISSFPATITVGNVDFKIEEDGTVTTKTNSEPDIDTDLDTNTDTEPGTDNVIVPEPDTNNKDTIDLNGNGETIPYEITSTDDLIKLATAVNSGKKFTNVSFKVTNDISLSNITDWTPIGNNSSNYFDGIIDFDNHEITSLYIIDNNNYKGLFGYTGTNSQISNVIIGNQHNFNTYINSLGGYIGTIVGYNKGKISSCKITGLLNILGNQDYIGGIVGYNEGTIENCLLTYDSTYIFGDSQYVGGISGFNKGVITNSSISYAEISGYKYVGGIVGFNEGTIDSKCTHVTSLSSTGNDNINFTISGTNYIANKKMTWNQWLISGYNLYVDYYELYSDNESICLDKEIVTLSDGTTPVKKDDTIVENYNYSSKMDDNALLLMGAGTSSNPYKISTISDLEYLADVVNNGNPCTGLYFALQDHIEFINKTFPSIGNPNCGTYDGIFDGTFDGQGYTFSNISTLSSTMTYVAPFGFIGENGHVKSINIVNFEIDEFVSLRGCGIAGFNNGTIENCTITNLNIRDGMGQIAGIAGHNSETGKILNCMVTDSVLFGYQDVGGITSYNAGLIDGCTVSNTTISCDPDEGRFGVFAASNSGTITNCLNDTEYSDIGS